MEIKYQFFRFLFAGGVAALANFSSRFLFAVFFDYEVSVFLAYLVGMLVAFVLMRCAVFNAGHGDLRYQGLKFLGVNILAVLQTLAISSFLARMVFPSFFSEVHAETYAHLVGILFPVFISYFGHKFLTFR